MVSLEAFRQLEAVQGSSTVTINGKTYGSVVIGESFTIDGDHVRLMDIADNMLLKDLGSLDDVLVKASKGSLIANNTRLCFAPSLVWAQRRDSLIEQSLMQARAQSCHTHALMSIAVS